MGAQSYSLCWKDGRTRQPMRRCFGNTTRRQCWAPYGGDIPRIANTGVCWPSVVAYRATSSSRYHYSFLLTLAIHSLHTSSCISSGPYCNVLDLSLFPSMSHRHSAHLQLYKNTETSLDKIWKTVLDVWNDTSSAEVARSFILAYRVMRLIIEENSWLSHGTPHCNVRKDYRDTATGVVPKNGGFYI